MTSALPPKRTKLTGPLIGTHNGQFHADEALAVFMLRLLPTYTSSPLIRTRDPAKLATCHTVVDVGGSYDATANRFDHHQREFTTTFPGRNTKLSAAGLVYLHKGRAIVAQVTGLPETSKDAELVYQKVYADLIEAFDANDNGVPAYDAAALDSAGIAKRFSDRGFSLASVVARMNYEHEYLEPSVEEDTTAAAEAAATEEDPQAAEDARFEKASRFAGGQFLYELQHAARAWLPARALVAQAFETRTQHDASGAILVLPHRDGGLPWADHLYSLEAAAGVSGQVLFALFPESGDPGCKWRVRAVSVAPGAFENRKGIKEEWRGVRDEELSAKAGIPGCVFVHASGFIGGNETFEGALAMAKGSL